ncbi:excisionase family protein, partial [Escherichia coli]|uniref:excisionase family protein n=4 Tax=Escherichia coli TaxID=562 RepID=UPI0003EE272C
GGKTSIFSHPVYLFLREFSLQDFRGGSVEGDPGHYSECLYNIEEIMRWIENQKQPGAKNASSG